MRALVCLALWVGAAQATVPEPAGYWQGPSHGDVPASIAGGRVIHTAELAALLHQHAGVLLDVAAAPKRPPNMAAGALWLPLPHLDVQGSTWIPDAGQPRISPVLDGYLRKEMAALSHADRTAPIVVYCHEQCWTSWNAAKRFISYGYTAVLWYPDGIEGWTAAGHQPAPAQPAG